jgi:hypothetical protein
MAQLRDIMIYYCRKYPHKNELSKARLTKMVYLADWKSAIDNDKQITSINWVFNHYGPYVEDVYSLALSDPDFNVESETTPYGNRKEVISLKRPNLEYNLTKSEIRILDHVIEETKRLVWDGFIQLVYSTFPVLNGVRGATMNLVRAARKYKIVSKIDA